MAKVAATRRAMVPWAVCLVTVLEASREVVGMAAGKVSAVEVESKAVQRRHH